jgi:hypothetical protein
MYAYSTHADIYPENSLVVHWYYSLEKIGSLCYGEQLHWHVSTGGGSTLLYLPWRRAGINLLEKRWCPSPVRTLVFVL